MKDGSLYQKHSGKDVEKERWINISNNTNFWDN